MVDLVSQRIDEHIRKNLPVAIIFKKQDKGWCGFCGISLGDTRPNFCSNCGVLLVDCHIIHHFKEANVVNY